MNNFGPSSSTFLRKLTTAVVCASFLLLKANGATSVSQFGITWTFSSDVPAGQFANGDWWIVGPVTITSISPASINGMNGSMTNPPVRYNNGVQGFDARMNSNTYDPTVNVALQLPLTLPAGCSLLSSVSYATAATGDNPQLQTIAILTILASPAPVGSFRPPYVGTDKTLFWNTSQLNYSVLRSLAPVTGTPTLSTVQGYFARDWIEINTGWTGRYMHPDLNYPSDLGGVGTYGREIAATVADGLLSLQLNYSVSQKQSLLIQIVQRGIDVYGAAKNGGQWGDGGGHNIGRKMPMLLAGSVLGDSNILAVANNPQIFSEDQQTFYVSQPDIDLVHKSVWASQGVIAQNYTQSDLGLPEWGFNHQAQPYLDDKTWGCPYRDVAGPCVVGHVLTAQLMGLKSAWGHPAIFDYYDRFTTIDAGLVADGPNDIHVFEANMWKAYRSIATNSPTGQSGGPVISPSSGNFLDSVLVSISSPTPGSTIYYSTDGTMPTTSSILYTGAFTLSAGAPVRAITVASGMANSPVVEADISVGAFVSYDTWQNVALPTQTNSFSIAFDITPSGTNINGVTGLSGSAAQGYTDLAAIVRLSPAGVIDARNGDNYEAINVLPYSAGLIYHVSMVLNLSGGTYSVAVTPPAGVPLMIASNYAFRTEQSSTAQLSDLAFYTVNPDTHRVENVQLSAGPPPISQAGPPLISPSSGNFLAPLLVSISSPTPGATIYYTTNGLTPTMSSSQYTAPLSLGASATVLAMAVASGMDNSPVAEADLTVGSFVSYDTWQNVPFPVQTHRFSVSFDLTPSGTNINAVTGIAATAAAAYTDLAAIVRFSSAGVIDSMNGDAYQATHPLAYSAGVTYHINMTIDLGTSTYSVVVWPPGGLPVSIASNYAFRAEQSSVIQLEDLGFSTVAPDTLTINNVQVSPTLAPPSGFRVVGLN